MWFLIGCIIAQIVLAGIVPFPWWVPDLALAGLVLTVIRKPGDWLLCATLVGGTMMLWAIRFPLLMLLSYVTAGGLARLMVRRWDLQDVRTLTVLTGGLVLAVQLFWLWIDRAWSWELFGLACGRAGLSALMIPLMRWSSGSIGSASS